jgi:hypothetical protein
LVNCCHLKHLGSLLEEVMLVVLMLVVVVLVVLMLVVVVFVVLMLGRRA